MNLRLAPEHLRFRISAQEFADLVAQGRLVGITTLSNALCLEYVVCTDAAATGQEGALLAFKPHHAAGTMHCELMVFANGIDQLSSGNVGKDGIHESIAFDNGEMLTVGLEIDLHSKKGR